MPTRGARPLLALQLVALAAVGPTVLLAAGLPLLSTRALGPAAFTALALGAGIATLAAGSLLLSRAVARPVDRLLAAAERLGDLPGAPGLPLLGEPGGHGLSRAAVAFERLAAALAEERAQLAAKVAELTAANRSLEEARESLLRSERLATVGRLAAGLAHEVGNPLGAVTGYVELARTRLPPGADPELAGALDRIAAAAERIDRTVRELLDFARPSAPLLVPVPLAPAVDSALRLARVQSRFKEVEVTVDLPPGLPPVRADPHQLSQVLLNLLLNAGDAMQGRGALRIEGRLGPDGTVALALADAGPGIPPQDLERIFDPFFTTKEPGRGTGLGLAISHRIMEGFGGAISAGNGPGGGARFVLRFAC
ncbi:sensor histidine kinase [Anaeromyxobacter paludicola]|uniref:histidine kinase n=1 Tax=Anaeromyxobacter paludicola TaxID=2918171 RepID=A0ABM7XB35_9BACT|nr:ATP-binding protein [Anaeromyxobacter paludicola]BDG09030.1 hypothetical protein AMPC_21430 [Anaeromyxobacter paludicola]